MSRNLVMSHAVGVGEPLSKTEVRAIIACAVANHCHGFSGIRWEIVNSLVRLLNADCIPVVPCQGSVGYLSHMAHIGLVVIGHGHAFVDGRQMTGSEALTHIGLVPAVLEGKEGLSLVGSAPCACGLACVALGKAKSLLSWSNYIAALSFEALKGQASVFDPNALNFRKYSKARRSSLRPAATRHKMRSVCVQFPRCMVPCLMYWFTLNQSSVRN